LILDALGQNGKVIASELSQRFGVSEDTVRRDLRELAREGLLHRVHGGALPRPPVSAVYAARQGQSADAKEAIGAAAVKLLAEGQLVAIDGGTTPLAVARQIPADLRLTVITHSLPAALALCEHPAAEVILVGGRLFKAGRGAVGAPAVDTYRLVRPDVCVLGAAGFHPEAGATTFDGEDAQVKRAMVEHASVVVAVAAAEKLGTVAAHVIVPTGQLTHLVTDGTASAEALRDFREVGVAVTIAG
jgi:DeoR/GlpR family transcriptional regulator of sugar metabolism